MQAGLSMEGVGGVTIQAIGLEMAVGEEGQVLSLVQIDDNMTQLWRFIMMICYTCTYNQPIKIPVMFYLLLTIADFV